MFSAPALRYFSEHAIAPGVAAALGVVAQGAELRYPYTAPDGSEYLRRRNLNEGITKQPKGQKLDLWQRVPVTDATGLILCEGESDYLAALSALYTEEGGSLTRCPDLPPPLRGLVPVAVPGAQSCHAKVAALGLDVWIFFDGDTAGRDNALKLAAAVRRAGRQGNILNLPDGRDLADLLHATSEPAEWIAEQIAAVEPEPLASAPAEPAPAPAGSSKAPPKFIARRVAEALRAETPIATNAAGQLYVYADGTYRRNEADLRSRLIGHLGDDWKRNKVDETLHFLRDSSPKLWPAPPRDRVNCTNGIVDLDGKLEQHSPDFLSPIQIPVAFDPAANCPAIERFVGEVLASDLVELVWELAGYLTIPDQSLQTAFMLLGEGANGKSTLLNLLITLIGKQNVASVALHRLDEDRFATAELVGKLANVFADLDARALQASSIFKSITGGDAITAERKYDHPFTFSPYARLLFSANEPPPTPDSSDAFFRRWQIIPFERRFQTGKADRRLIDRLTTPAELSGLLNHGLVHLEGLQQRGAFRTSDSGEAAKERFRTDSDSVAGFIDDACRVDPDARTPKSRFYEAYKAWCIDSNRRAKGKQKFNRQIAQRFGEVTLTGTRMWDGITVEDAL
jgi:putative DNA primase/helicase